jgi:phasin family protein
MADVTTDTQTLLNEVKAPTTEGLDPTKAVSGKSFDEAVAAMKESMSKATATVEASQLHVTEGITRTLKTAEEVVAFSQGNVEALIKCGQIWSTGLQDISRQMASSMQASYEEAVSAFKALTTVKSLKEAVDLQVGLARSTVKKSLAESGKYTDASLKLAEQALAPISSRVSVAVETFGKPV